VAEKAAPEPQPNMSAAEGELSKSAKKRAAKKARDAAAAEAEAPAPAPAPPPAPEPKAKAKAKAKAEAKAEPAPPPAEPKAKAKGKAKAKAEPEPPAPPAPEPKAKAKGKAKAEPKAAAASAPGGYPAAEPKAAAKSAAKAAAKSQPAQAKAKAAAKKVEEEEEVKERKEELINYFIDDGTGGDWEVNTGLSKKQQRRKEREAEEKAAAKAAGIRPGVQQQYIPGMAPVGASSQPSSKASQAVAAAEVAAILNKKSEVEVPAPGSVSSATVKVPEKKIGIVIGPKGSKIQLIQEKTGAKIDTTGEIFTITGPPAAVSQAEMAIKELVEKGYCAMQYEDFAENFVNVHPSCFPDLIGKQGVVIREIKDKLGVEVSIPQVPPGAAASKKFKVGLAGSTANVEKAKNVINDIVMYGHSELTHPGQVHAEVEVEPWCYKYIIGKGGSELKHIQHNWKVRVNIPREHSACQQVLIVGEQDQVDRAKTYMEKMLWEAENQSRGRDKVDNSYGDVWGDEGEEEDWMKAYLYKRT